MSSIDYPIADFLDPAELRWNSVEYQSTKAIAEMVERGRAFEDWMPRYDDPRSVVPRALAFAAEVGTLPLLDRLAWETLSGLDGWVYWRVRAALLPGKWELSPLEDVP